MRKFRWLAIVLAFVLVAAACGGDDDDADTTTTAGDTQDTVDLTQGGDLTFHMVTHSDDGPFWSVVKRGMDDACAAVGVNCVWSPSVNTPEKQVQDIDAAIAAASDGIAISLASPDQVGPAAERVVAAGIPLYTLNSGLDFYKALGAVTHIGQTEFVAGQGAGERFNALGVSHVLCARQEQSNVGLEERCAGLADTFSGQVTSEFGGLDNDIPAQEAAIAAILAADPSIDAILGVGPPIAISALNASETAGRGAAIGGFDLTPEILDAIETGTIAFTVDQQQYLQGYLPIILMFLQATNQNTAGGGLPILTGPGFVTSDNATEVKDLSAQGTR